MPRKPKQERIRCTIVVDGASVPVTLYPPKPPRKSWYVYWPGLKAAKSTNQDIYAAALDAATAMLQNKGKLGHADDLTLNDKDFEEIQRRHFAKRKDPAAQVRAQKSLTSCLEAIAAFRDIAGVEPVARAVADDCERFQARVLELPRDWLTKHDPASSAMLYSSNTALKWSRELQAAFERANRNAGKKCVRGVVSPRQLLTENPWKQFNWIEGVTRPIRQFDDEELTGFLDHLTTGWPQVTVVQTLAKTLLWSWCRKREVVELKWSACRIVGTEVHFEIVGKWGIEKWFRIPNGLYDELLSLRTDSPYVFAAFNDQIRRYHTSRNRPTDAALVTIDFRPLNLGKWLERRLHDWSQTIPGGVATMHVFRKTSLQYARRGADVNEQVAMDARVGTAVMMRHYVKEEDPERRNASNRTFQRIVASLAPATATRYGHAVAQISQADLERTLRAAVEAKDWHKAAELSIELQGRAG